MNKSTLSQLLEVFLIVEMNIAIIPARGGSKRIPRKNIRDFIGKPIIAYSIEAALESGLFDEIMVSTDDSEIAEISKKYGAKVPFMRSEKTSDDYAPLADVVAEVLNEYGNIGRFFDSFCCILSTAPFISPSRLVEAYTKLIGNDFDSVLPVLRYSYPIQRSLKMVNGIVTMVYPEFRNIRSQDIEPRFHDSGQFYWMKTLPFYEQKTLFSARCGAVELQEKEVQDIDSEEDWGIAEIKYRLLKND